MSEIAKSNVKVTMEPMPRPEDVVTIEITTTRAVAEQLYELCLNVGGFPTKSARGIFSDGPDSLLAQLRDIGVTMPRERQVEFFSHYSSNGRGSIKFKDLV